VFAAIVPETEPNDTTATANMMNVGDDFTGIISDSTDFDTVRFTIAGPTTIVATTVLGTLSDTTLTLFDTNGVTVLDFNDDFGGGLASRIQFPLPIAGAYFLQVRAFGEKDQGSYVLELRALLNVGACCDRSFGLCADGVLEADCIGARAEWTEGVLCQDLAFPCIPAPMPTALFSDSSLTFMAGDLDLRQDTNGPSATKADFEIWNEDEVRFSGTERCVTCWDTTLAAFFNAPNHFLIPFLHTNKGRARVNGIGSIVCPGSVDVALLGVIVRELTFSGFPFPSMRSAITPVGEGVEDATILYDIPVRPEELSAPSETAAPVDAIGRGQPLRSVSRSPKLPVETFAAQDRGAVSDKGSLLFWPRVELRWNNNGLLIHDTFVSLTNDFPDDVYVQLYFVNGDEPLDAVFIGDPPQLVERAHPGWNNVDAQVLLTGNESTYWSTLTGRPKSVARFLTLDPGPPFGRPDTDPRNPGGRMLRGFVVGWAVDRDGKEINWNHLSGSATGINYREANAWEYNAWAVQCVSGVAVGQQPDGTPGQLNLNNVEYAPLPERMLFDFYATGSQALSPAGGP